MENIKKFKKLFIVLIFALAILIGTKVQAETFTPTYTRVIDGHFNPYKADGTFMFYCIHHGSPYRVTVPAGYAEGNTQGSWCEVCGTAPAAPWDGTKYNMTYESKEIINDRDYQDAAYVMANAVISGKIEDMETQWSLWMTGLNLGTRGGRYSGGEWVEETHGIWGDEALAYKNFYNTIHSNNTDIYSSKVYDKTDISNVTVEVDQNSKTYIVGPFTVEYPIGEYGTQKWSYISNIYLLNQDNNSIGDVVNNTIHITDSAGNELRDTIHGNNFPDTNKEFYVKFTASSLVDNIKLKVDFAYLESCSAKLQKYTGTLHNWVWEAVETDNVCPVCHTKLKTWKLKVENGGNPQELVALKYDSTEQGFENSASKNYKQTSLIMAPIPVDLTMKISGQVFLDRDSGKVNVGNNIMDGNSEALQGVEVVLYDATTNQVVEKTTKISQYHVHTPSCYTLQAHTHTGDPYTGGGCYTHKIHDHLGDWENGGPCYSNAVTHVHSGNPSGTVKKHYHTEECGEQKKTCVITGEIERKEDGGLWFWEVHSSGGECGQIGRNLWYTGTQYWLDNEHPELKDWESRSRICGEYGGDGCEYEDGQDILVGDGCYTKPVYHTHTDACYGGEAHKHTDSCYSKRTYGRADDGCTSGDYGWQNGVRCSHGYTYNREEEKTLTCTKKETSGELTCGLLEGQIERFELGCGRDSNDAMYLELTCNKPLYELGCSNTPVNVLTCNQGGQVANTTYKTLKNPVITNDNGYYEFDGLDSMKKYYVKFVYNGILYTNVLYNSNNADNVSKADETSRYDYRTPFNNKFAEIGSYPSNYKIINKVFGEELGDYNKVYLQKDIAEIFRKISAKMVGTNTDNYVGACINTYNDLRQDSKYTSISNEELKRIVQFAADCRITSQTVQNYPLTNTFTISAFGKTVGNVFYPPIYSGTYNQLHINLGIKARPAFDMKLDKNVKTVEVNINGKNEIYNYNPDANIAIPRVGISEIDYINGMRQAYKDGKTDLINSKDTTYEIARNNLEIYVRPEEMTNGTLDNSSNSNIATYGTLSNEDKLKVLVTYRIKIENQGSTEGAVTEIVDYYDTNFNFVRAYFGDEQGTELKNIGTVAVDENSKYSGTEYKATRNGYKTIYLRPTEKILGSSEAQYIYVTFELNNVGELLTSELILNNKEQLSTMNLAEINGYKTSEGQIDIDSTPGNFNIADIDNINNIVEYKKNHPELLYEDDAERAQALVFKRQESRTVEGIVFEDATGKAEVKVGDTRSGNGILDSGENGIAGVIVELVEIKNDKMVVRAQTKTNQNGWYGFTGFIPGDYIIRYTYGSDNDTALSKGSVYQQGLNDKSYNGQDYQSTTYTIKGDTTQIKPSTDDNLIQKYIDNNNVKNTEESIVQITDKMTIDKHNTYWYTVQNATSDAKDYEYRTNQVKEYSKSEYGTEITNHKAEVFNSYMNPQPEHINAEANEKLVNELERRTFRYAYTPVIEVEVEYATKVIEGNKKYEHKITGVDFGIVERPKSELTIDQDIKHIKVTLADGRVLFDTETGTDNLQWINKGDMNKYDKNELINIIIDEELINGATLEIEYYLTVTNNSEQDTGTTRAKTILNYVANNLNFDEADNGNLWKVISKEEVQNDKKSSFVNNEMVDLSTQSIILQATSENPLTNTNLNPGEKVSTTLKLTKVLAAESSTDDLTYTNMTEIVEIDNTVGRYDHGATPGNQKLELQPREHDTSGASKYVGFDNDGNIDPDHPQDGQVIVTPPTGSNYIYYVIGITSSLILIAGIFLIKKFVIDKKK